MEFDIGNILYVVITLVVVIVGLLGKKKKPASTGSEPETSSKPQGGIMENLEKMLRMGQEDPLIMDLKDHESDLYAEEEMEYEEAEPEASPAEVGSDQTFQEEYQQILDRLSNRESAASIYEEEGGNLEPLEVIQLEDEQGTDYFEIIKDFDAGTAVVYSAIINRVDY